MIESGLTVAALQASTLAVSLKDGLFVVSWPRAAALPVPERDRIEPRRSAVEG